MKRGDIYYANFDGGVGSEQIGIRPVVVIQNDAGNKYSPTTIVSIITSKHKRHLPTHVFVKKDDANGLAVDSTIELEQLKTVDKSRLCGDRIGFLSAEDLNQVERALKISLGIKSEGEQRIERKGKTIVINSNLFASRRNQQSYA